MKFSLLPFFTQRKKQRNLSPLIQTLQRLEHSTNLLVFSNVTIYYHTQKHTIALLIFDPLRGVYIFEVKPWSFKDLHNATITKEKMAKPQHNTLAYNSMQEIIKKKFQDLIHHDNIPIFNYLILENLSSTEYNQLDETIKVHLPQNRIIFQNLSRTKIIKKLKQETKLHSTLANTDTILGNLLIQYTIVEDEKLHFCNHEQRKFIDTPLQKEQHLYGDYKSGKTSTILLKAIYEILKNPQHKIVIIKPNTLAKDILQKKFLAMIEHAIISFNLDAFEIVTPTEVLNKHLHKFNTKNLIETKNFTIDKKLMKTSFYLGDTVMCDDVELLPPEFLKYLKHIQQKRTLLFVHHANKAQKGYEYFSRSYQNTQRTFQFQKTNPYAKALHLITTLIQKHNTHEILFVANDTNREKFQDDVTSFVACDTTLLNGEKHLIQHNLNNLLLATYNDIIDINAKYVMLLDGCDNINQLDYALQRASHTTYVLYDACCDTLVQLKDKLENN